MKKMLWLWTALIVASCTEASSLNVEKLTPVIDSIAQAGIDGGAYPGCQMVISQNGKVVFNKCYGVHSLRTPLPVMENDLYDLASVTKTTATLLGIMRLYEDGLVDLDEKASLYLPFYRGSDKEDITVRDLLFHESGLPSTISFFYKAIDPASITEPLLQSFKDDTHPGQIDRELFISDFKYREGAISTTEDDTHHLQVYKDMWLADSYIDTLKKDIIAYPYTGKYYQYSDIGFISLQWIVESLTGQSLDAYVENTFYKPMGAERTLFVPIRRFPLNEIVPTVTEDCLRSADEICGYTQDEVAAYMGGVAGEAGLFSTACDLVKIYQMYLNKGILDGKRYFKESTIDLFTTERSKISHRGLGFDRPNLTHPEWSPCVTDTPASAYGHSGFTGPNVWVDPENGLVYAFVCNRVSPYPWNNILNDMGIFGKIQQAIYDNIQR